MRGFVGYLIMLSVVVVLFRVDFFFTVVYFLVAIYVLSRLWTQRILERLTVTRHFTRRAFIGEQVRVDLTVRNGAWLPVPWLEVNEALPVQISQAPFQSQVVTLGPRKQWEFSYTLRCRQRGYYTVGPLRLQTGDLLGVQKRVAARIAPEHLTVYPRVVPLSALGLPTRSPMVTLPAVSPLFEDPSRLMGIRNYQRGDSPRRIHWTATARARQLVVKQYQPAIARETLICLNMNAEDYELRNRYRATELAIVVAASLASHIVLHEKLPVGLATEAVDPLHGDLQRISVQPRPGRAHLIANVLEPLARVQVASEDEGADVTFPELLRRESVGLRWGATMVAVTGREDEELYDTLLLLRHAGLALSLVVVGPGERGGGHMAPVLMTNRHRVWTDADLETLR